MASDPISVFLRAYQIASNVSSSKREQERRDEELALLKETHQQRLKETKLEEKRKELESRYKQFETLHGKPGIREAVEPPDAGVDLSMLPPGLPTSREAQHPEISFEGFEDIGVQPMRLRPQNFTELLAQKRLEAQQKEESEMVPVPEVIASEFGQQKIHEKAIPAVSAYYGRQAAGERAEEANQVRRDIADAANQTRLDVANIMASARDQARTDRQADRNTSREDTMADDYQKAIKPFLETNRAVARVKALDVNDPSGFDDAALIYAFNKVLDEGSVVREGERDYIAKIGSIKQRFSGAIQRALTGAGLTPAMRKELLATTQRLHNELQPYADRIKTHYRDVATRRGLNPDNVVFSYGDAPPAQGPAGGQGAPGAAPGTSGATRPQTPGAAAAPGAAPTAAPAGGFKKGPPPPAGTKIYRNDQGQQIYKDARGNWVTF